MKTFITYESNNITTNFLFPGESIERKIERITTNKEPIGPNDQVPMIYTERKEGVRPEFDIRSDKWEIAQKAMTYANKEHIAKRKEKSKTSDEPSNNNAQEPQGVPQKN